MRTFLSVVLALWAAPAHATTTIFLDFAGSVPGGSVDTDYLDWIEIGSLDLEGFSRTTFDGTGGRTVLPAQFGELSLVKATSESTGPLFTSFVTRAVLPTATIDIVGTTGGPVRPKYLTLTLTAPLVTGIQVDAVDGGTEVTETITLGYTQICLQTYTLDTQTGNQVPDPATCYDVSTRTAL